jgi:primosomal protein N' (replication factor Y) (superfamily II helicase)
MKVPVLLPKIFNYPFTYKNELKGSLKIGDIVFVPFGKNLELGVIWDNFQNTNKNIKLKKIEKKVDNISIKKNLVDYINWFSMYNIVPKGLVLKMCLGDKKNILKLENIVEKNDHYKTKKYILNNEQKHSYNELIKFGKNFSVSVLQGITGSGKTLVYFERIKDIINNNKQALVLLPEIFLTNQFKKRFEEYFGFEPAVWHSKITPKNKRKIWQGIINNKVKLVIGARSSLLLPFKNLGIIIVDEEHDPSYKQDESLIYNARDMAISRANFENIPIHLVTSVPSLETFNHIKNKKYNLTKIQKRYSNFPLPETKIINLNLLKLKSDEYISSETMKLVEQYLKKNQQILFFLNRRGYAPFLICKKCGFKHACPDCSLYLTYHKSINRLMCHHCGLKIKKEKKCQKEKYNCDFRAYGPGVEKIYEELKSKLKNYVINIFSSDFLTKKKDTLNILEKIEQNKINIIVGTQMISKGFNFPNLNCIVIIDADFTGKGYDLRTTEKNIQLYNQLSGRAGRFSKKSLIIYQTTTPTNETLQDILANDPEKFLINELNLRKKNKLPPFCRLISLIISASSAKDSVKGAQEIKKKLSLIKDLEILGPVDSPIFRIKKKYRARLLIKSDISGLIQKKIANILQSLVISKKIKLTVDVDPINFT